jgi:DNA polymerase elongation subunit (family B)
MNNVEDLPVAPGTVLTQQQAAGMRSYNENDVMATKMFYERSVEKIQLREELSASYQRDFLNYSDVKIGTTIFEIELERAGIQLYNYDDGGRSPRQTKRTNIALTDCIPKWVKFDNPAFARVLDYLRAQVVTETKGVFQDLTTHAGGLEFVFGTGGLHGSIEGAKVVARGDMVIKSKDVSSYYPNLAIHHKFYPEHLTEKFCAIYEMLYEKRKTYPKGSTFNAAYKLALNGTFGVSNSPFSVFYDPQFMLSITLSGQMMLCMLIEKIIEVPTAQIIMANTDGIEYTIHPYYVEQADEVCRQWEKLTKLELEGVDYRQMFIANVNNYVAQKVNGDVKQKGAFLTQRDYHQNASALVVPKVAEKVLLEGADIEQTVRSWPDKMDFMCRVKINRGSHLRGVKDGNDYVLPNLTRYYVSEGGYALIKLMPPLAKKPTEWRRIGVESGWTVCPCNKLEHAVLPIDYQYYIDEVKKLVDPLKEI